MSNGELAGREDRFGCLNREERVGDLEVASSGKEENEADEEDQAAIRRRTLKTARNSTYAVAERLEAAPLPALTGFFRPATVCAPNFLVKRSTRPSVSSNF